MKPSDSLTNGKKIFDLAVEKQIPLLKAAKILGLGAHLAYFYKQRLRQEGKIHPPLPTDISDPYKHKRSLTTKPTKQQPKHQPSVTQVFVEQDDNDQVSVVLIKGNASKIERLITLLGVKWK